MSKKAVFIISLLLSLLFFIAMYPVELGVCSRADYDCRGVLELIQVELGVLPIVLLFSLVTYKMKEEVFRAWWRVAKWFVPIIVFFTFLFNYSGGGGSGVRGAYGDTFAMFSLTLLYLIFVITSLVKIILAYRRTR